MTSGGLQPVLQATVGDGLSFYPCRIGADPQQQAGNVSVHPFL
jgi:hypothetical protein